MKISEILTTPSNIDENKFGDLVLDRMRERDIRYDTVSSDLNLPASMLRLIITGKRQLPSKKIEEIIKYFDISYDEIPISSKKEIVLKGEKIFISYSHKDTEFMERLMVHLKPLKCQGLIDPWIDTKLLAGEKWKKEIKESLNVAKVAILLVSADFLASDFIVNNELPLILQHEKKKGVLIIPIILKPCRFTRDKNLHEFQAINSPDLPIIALKEYDRELIYDTVAQRIEAQFSDNDS